MELNSPLFLCKTNITEFKTETFFKSFMKKVKKSEQESRVYKNRDQKKRPRKNVFSFQEEMKRFDPSDGERRTRTASGGQDNIQERTHPGGRSRTEGPDSTRTSQTRRWECDGLGGCGCRVPASGKIKLYGGLSILSIPD